MTTRPDLAPEPEALSWYIVGRWREYEAEARVNIIRVAGIAAFYLVELANYRGFRIGGFELPRIVDRPFHLAVTSVAVAWTMLSLSIQLCLARRIFPTYLKFVSTAADILLMTCVLAVSHGPASPLIVGYLLILALATMRFSLPLIRFATTGSILGYLALLAHAKWYAPESQVPRYHEIIFLLALGLTGLTLGQVLRRVHAMALDYARRRDLTSEPEGGRG